MAIELPNNKISRTLPEQVGFNSSMIEKIIKWINDSDFIDKVLNLSDPSGTLTEAQYAIADLSPSYIVYGGKVFIKALEDSDNIDFFKAGTDMSGSDSMIASVERVRVVKATKAYQYAVVQLFESYNKTQLDTLLSAKADLSGATFTGDVKALTFEQDQPSFSQSLTILSTSGITVEQIYSRLIVVNKILMVIVNCKYTNNTGESKTVYQHGGTNGFDIPAQYGEKIFDLLGNKVSETPSSNTLVCSVPGEVRSNATPGATAATVQIALTNVNSANKVKLDFFSGSGLTIPDGESRYIMGRFFISLY